MKANGLKTSNNINYTLQNNICTGCGICEDVCPKHCITIKRVNGEHRPMIDEALCVDCGKCLKVCPGMGINLSQISADLYSHEKDIKQDKYIGRYVALHTGYSTDNDIRLHSASGGMVSQFLVFLLEKGIIDGAVVTGFGKDKLTPLSYVARTRDEVLAARSSKYCPVALNKVGNEIASLDSGRYVVIGVPCHIQGFRKRMKIDKRLRERIVGLFSIFCSSGRTFHAQDFIFYHYGVRRDNVDYFAYRDNGCLGYLTIKERKRGVGDEEFPSLGAMKECTECRESKFLKKISIPFTRYYGPLLRSFFKPHRCLTCIDHYGELADVCFGDIHIKPYSDDKVGISSWIVRTAEWEALFRQAKVVGYIEMND